MENNTGVKEQPVIQHEGKNDAIVPDWFSHSVMDSLSNEAGLKRVVDDLESLDLSTVETYVGGSIDQLPYQVLKILFPRGSDSLDVADVLKKKRTSYLLEHPEEAIARPTPYYIDPHGVTSPDDGEPLSMAKLRGITVGDTCIHYAGDVPGMDDRD